MAKKSFFDELVKKAGNEFAAKAEEGLDSDIVTFVDTGSYAFNALISGSIHGGIPANKIFCVAGEESTGKTFYALSICKSFLDANPEGAVFYFETEHAIDTKILDSKDIDKSRFYSIPVTTVQEFRTQAVRIVDEYLAQAKEDRKPLFFVLDSLGMLSTDKEIKDMGEGKDTRDMTRAQLIRGTFRALSLKMGRAQIPFLLTNHTYDVIGSYVPEKDMGGGSGAKYAASVIIFLSKKKAKDTDGTHFGNIIVAKINKSRLTREGLKVETLLDYTKGLDKYYGLVDIGLAGGVFKKVSTKIELPDGTTAFESTIKKNPTKYFTPEVLKMLDEAAGRLFKYGAGENVPEDEELVDEED